MKRTPLFVVAACSLILIAVRNIWPNLKFDEVSTVLFGIAVAAMLVAFLPIKKLKWGEFEAELDRAVNSLERKVKETESSPSTAQFASLVNQPSSEKSLRPTWEVFFDEYISLVNSPASNVEKILGATILLEKMTDTFTSGLGNELGARGRGPRYAIDRLAEQGLITEQERDAFKELWSVRNKVVHEGIRPTDEQTARILDLAWRLVRTLG